MHERLIPVIETSGFPKTKGRVFYDCALVVCVCLAPVMAALAPRALALLPLVIGILGYLAFRVFYGRWPLVNKGFSLCAAVFLGLLAISSVWALDAGLTWERFLKLGPLLISLVLGFSVFRAVTLPKIFYIFFPASVLCAGVMIAVDLYTQGLLYRLVHPDYQGWLNLSNLNRSVVTFVVCVFPAFFMLRHGTARRVVRGTIAVSIAFLLVLILFQTESQSIQLAAILGGLVLVAFPVAFPARSRLIWSLLAGVIVAGILLAPWFVQSLFNFAPDVVAGQSWLLRGYALDRMEIWDFVARRAMERPFLGHGIEATRLIKDFDTGYLYHPENEVMHPHNFILQIWIEFGVLGAAMCALFVALFLRVIKISVRNKKLCLAVFVMCFSVACTGYGLWQSWWIGMFIYMVILCVSLEGENPQRHKL